jgi:hypothetical protein
MTKTTGLVILLRVIGVSGLLALVAVFMPMSWMAGVHGWLGLGEMPTSPVVAYLARSLSVFYALFGALLLVMAGDMDRYRPLVRLLGILVAVGGAVLAGIDLSAPMPWWWTLDEGPLTIAMGLLIFYLAR